MSDIASDTNHRPHKSGDLLKYSMTCATQVGTHPHYVPSHDGVPAHDSLGEIEYHTNYPDKAHQSQIMILRRYVKGKAKVICA